MIYKKSTKKTMNINELDNYLEVFSIHKLVHERSIFSSN